MKYEIRHRGHCIKIQSQRLPQCRITRKKLEFLIEQVYGNTKFHADVFSSDIKPELAIGQY